METREILKNVIEELGETANSFINKLGYKSPTTVYHVLNGVNSVKGLSDTMKDRIVRTYPSVSYEYLGSGEGPILLEGNELKNQLNFFNIATEKPINPFVEFGLIPDKLERMIELQEETNSLLKLILEKD
jgi:hypothetical protein